MSFNYKRLGGDAEAQALEADSESLWVSSVGCTKHHKWLSQKRLGIYACALKDLLLISFAILGFIGLLHQQKSNTNMHSQHPEGGVAGKEQPATSKLTSCDCGNSTANALLLGCKYDSLAAAWLPEHCRDDELTAEFERSGPGPGGKWTYWTDSAHTEEISIEEIAKIADHPDRRFHTTGHWHVIHCIFYWRKEQRARFNGKIVEPRSYSEAHSKHCGKIFLDPGRDTIAGVALKTDAD